MTLRNAPANVREPRQWKFHTRAIKTEMPDPSRIGSNATALVTFEAIRDPLAESRNENKGPYSVPSRVGGASPTSSGISCRSFGP